MTGALGVSSEIGRLRAVMVHRPGVEIARLTPDNKADLLFDDLLWLERAQQEHDRFAQLMVDRDVEVVYFEDLLTEAIADDGVRDDLLDRVVTPTTCGPRVAEALGALLRQAPRETVVEVLVGGLLERELVDWGIEHLYEDLVADRFHHVLRPLPNLLFMRDNAAWINRGLSLSVLATPARERESLYMQTIYRHHPRFAGERFPVWFGAEPTDVYPASIEGGDVLVLSPETVIVGLGQRTAPAAVEMLARRLFADGEVARVIVVHLPHDRSVMHLDTVFTMVDVDTFNVFPGLLESVDVYTLNPAPNGKIKVVHDQSLEAALTAALDRHDLVMVHTGGDAIGRFREQWDDGNNTLALAPGLVVGYERNQETNRRLPTPASRCSSSTPASCAGAGEAAGA